MRIIVSTVLMMLMVVVFGGTAMGGEFLQVQGSDTMVNLAQNLAESYMDAHDDAVIAVTGGGSGTGVAALINRTVDIANISRLFSETEMEQAKNNTVDPVRIIIAMDGLSVITHESIGIDALTVEEIGAIFRGDITNWAQVGGPDRRITLYGRQSNSGTYVYFRANILKDDYSMAKRQMNGNAQIVEAVLNDTGGIGYVGIGYVVDGGQPLPGLTILNVAVDEDTPAASPLVPENVQTGLYPIARPLNMYIDGEPEGVIRNFFEFVLSDAGQQVAVNIGFYPVSPEYQKMNAELGF